MKYLLLTVITALNVAAAGAADVQSVSRIAFGSGNTLFVADWKQAKVHAIELPSAAASSHQPFNLRNFQGQLDKAVGASPVVIEDMAARPESGEIYVAVSYGPAHSPAIVVATAAGDVHRLVLKSLTETVADIDDAPSGNVDFWKTVPERSFTVTDMKWHAGQLYVAGLSNQTFASTLRIYNFPFHGKASTTSVEIYHTTHNQVETRAPIRAMAFADLDGKPYLVAAYTCTPLVTIALADLKNGAHVRGKTIAELGFGNTPNGMLAFSTPAKDGKAQDQFILVTNVNRNADAIPLHSIMDANDKPSLAAAVDWGVITGVDAQPAPIANVLRMDNYSDDMFIALRRDLASGEAELVTIGKQFKLRLSDFISEYDFPSYTYSAEFQKKYLKPVQDQMMRQEGYGDLVAPNR